MHHSITHNVTAPDGLTQTSYTYVILDRLDLTLDSIIYRSRATKRHGFKAVKSWHRIDKRNSNMDRYEPSQEVKDAVRRAINEGLRFI